MKWTEEEINLLKQHYPNKSRAYLSNIFPSRTPISIYRKAEKLNLRKIDKGLSVRIGDLSPLLKETKGAYYWIGFLLADGCFSKSGRVELKLAKKDSGHLYKFSKLVNANLTFQRKQCSVAVKDINLIKNIVQKFDIKPQKTYRPPNIEKVLQNKSYELKMSLLAGFIDGDGCIRNYTVHFKNHKSWISFYDYYYHYMKNFIEINSQKPIINNEGFASFYVNFKKLYCLIKPLKIDHLLMERKWFQ